MRGGVALVFCLFGEKKEILNCLVPPCFSYETPPLPLALEPVIVLV